MLSQFIEVVTPNTADGLVTGMYYFGGDDDGSMKTGSQSVRMTTMATHTSSTLEQRTAHLRIRVLVSQVTRATSFTTRVSYLQLMTTSIRSLL